MEYELTPIHLKIELHKILCVLLYGNLHDKAEGRSVGIHVRCVCKGACGEGEMRSERFGIPIILRCKSRGFEDLILVLDFVKERLRNRLKAINNEIIDFGYMSLEIFKTNLILLYFIGDALNTNLGFCIRIFPPSKTVNFVRICRAI